MTRFDEDELPTRPTSEAHRAAELVRSWARLSKANQALVLSLIKALLGLALIACTFAGPSSEPAAAPRESAATVVMLSADHGTPNCSGVSVLDARGHVVLLTAAHCVTRKSDPDDMTPDAAQTAQVGDVLRYLVRGRTEQAELIYYDAARDRAELQPDELEAPLPLAVHRLSNWDPRDDPVRIHAISALYGQIHTGLVTGTNFAGDQSHFWESDMTVIPGWSGSPVLNESGQVVGIVAKCSGRALNAGDHVVKTCEPGWSIFTDAL